MPDDVPAQATVPLPPFTPREYALMSREAAGELFAEGVLVDAAPWGLLYCHDGRGFRWTVFGPHEYVEGLLGAERPTNVEPEPARAPGPMPSGRGVGGPVLTEFPLEAFRPEYVTAGWPDDWPGMNAVHTWPFELVLDTWERLADELED